MAVLTDDCVDLAGYYVNTMALQSILAAVGFVCWKKEDVS